MSGDINHRLTVKVISGYVEVWRALIRKPASNAAGVVPGAGQTRPGTMDRPCRAPAFYRKDKNTEFLK